MILCGHISIAQSLFRINIAYYDLYIFDISV